MVDFAPATRPLTVAEKLALLPDKERRRLLSKYDDEELVELMYDWHTWAREKQLPPPGGWNHWGIMWGRGTGKTRSAAEFFRAEIETGKHTDTAMVGRSAGDVRKVMVQGPSGILSVCHPDFMPDYQPSLKRLVWPNGCITLLFNATEPEELRGPEHSLYWADEVGAWKRAVDTWDNLMFGFRRGAHPRGVFTTTPRPTTLIKDLAASNRADVAWAPGASTYENASNLATTFLTTILRKYEGTRLARQEIMGELLLDMPGALWTHNMIQRTRVPYVPNDPTDEKRKADLIEQMGRIVIAIDPAVTTGEDSAETGIICVGRDKQPVPHFYVFDDRSGRWAATQWAKKALRLFRERGADRIVAEVNNGGDLVEATIRQYSRAGQNAPYKAVHASRGKYVRGEPVAALYDQKRVHHVGMFTELEDQMVTFLPDDDREEASPDRADALIWGITELAGFHEAGDIPPSVSYGPHYSGRV